MQHDSGRSTFLSAILCLLAGVGILFGGFLLCGGFAFYVLAVISGLATFGTIHYLLWGQSLSREVADERAEEEPPAPLEGNGEAEEDPFRRRR